MTLKFGGLDCSQIDERELKSYDFDNAIIKLISRTICNENNRLRKRTAKQSTAVNSELPKLFLKLFLTTIVIRSPRRRRVGVFLPRG